MTEIHESLLNEFKLTSLEKPKYIFLIKKIDNTYIIEEYAKMFNPVLHSQKAIGFYYDIQNEDVIAIMINGNITYKDDIISGINSNLAKLHR